MSATFSRQSDNPVEGKAENSCLDAPQGKSVTQVAHHALFENQSENHEDFQEGLHRMAGLKPDVRY